MAIIDWEQLDDDQKHVMRLAAEQSPLAFTSLWFQVSQGDKFVTNWHHHYYKWATTQLLESKATNIVINVCPGSTKTEYWSIHLPAFCFSKFERVRILNTSYSKDLVNENSERTRDLISSKDYQEVYDVELGKGKVDDWTIERNGKRKHHLLSRSAGGQITGVRGGYMGNSFTGYIAADDWDKPDDMFSETKRKKSQQRLSNTLRSRRAVSSTPIIFIQQRLHESDSTAFLLRGGMGVTVDLHITVPALINQEYIDALPTEELRQRAYSSVKDSKQINGYWSYWPEKDTIDDLMALQESDPYTFMSQYMQSPESLEGGIFKQQNFRFYNPHGEGDGEILPLPKFEYRFITADTAQKTKARNDFTVFAEWGYFEGRIYRLSYLRAKMEAPELRQMFESFCTSAYAKNSADNGNLRAIYVEDKSSGTGLIQELNRVLPVKITAVQRNIDKLTRAMDCQPHHAQGKVVLPYGDKDNFEFVLEVSSFTDNDSHKHDDQTDVMLDAIDVAIIAPLVKTRKIGVILPTRR